jgi:oxaloacetate decarboxylase alpha subunit
MGKVKITETVLRDAHQSLIATRMRIENMLPVIEKLDKVGYQSLECWGGATFDACLRFLNEDPWDRLRKIRDKAKNTKLQMLLRGQNLLGYKHYPDDVVEYFVQKAIANGIDFPLGFCVSMFVLDPFVHVVFVPNFLQMLQRTVNRFFSFHP